MTCIDVETAKQLRMDPTPALSVHFYGKHECGSIWPDASAWGFRGDEATTDLVKRMLMEALTKALTKARTDHGGWTGNTIDCFTKATTPDQLVVCMRLVVRGDEVSATTKEIVTRAAGWAKLKPLTCKQAAARFYSAERLANVKMPRFSAAERQRAIAETQQEFLKDCKNHWPEVHLRCFADARDYSEQMMCMNNNLSWAEVPLFGSLLPSKVKACDLFPTLYKKCANVSNQANGILESMAGARLTLFHAEPGSPDEKLAIEDCHKLAEEIKTADMECAQ